MKGNEQIDSVLIQRILSDIFENKSDDLEKILSKLKYADVKYKVITYLTKLVQNSQIKDRSIYEKVFNILENITIDGSEKSFAYTESKKNKKFKPSTLRNLLGKAWCALVKCSLPDNLREKIMIALGDGVLERFTNVTSIADNAIETFEKNQILGVASLKAICYLMRYGQIEYLEVYDVIMTLLNEQLFSSVHLARFFGDLDVFLSSKNLCHTKAGEFAKRLAELAQSTAAVEHLPMILKLILNILKRHPQSQTLIHTPKISDIDSQSPANNLIELKSFQNHFDCQIRSLAEQINYKLNDKIDTMTPSASVTLSKQRLSKSKAKIQAAIEFLMNSNCSIPIMTNIEYLGNMSMDLIQ